MTNGALDQLAQAYGIAPSFVSETGELRVVSDDTKRALLAAMGVAAASEQAIQEALSAAPAAGLEPQRAPPCFLPDWLREGRCWGISCQLYGLASRRNQGIGDFEDLARLCEIGAAAGADFVGVNPLHALFWSQPDRASPYSPSTRQFLNPLYIALDRVPGVDSGSLARRAASIDGRRVDYAAVARMKQSVLEEAFARTAADPAFARFQAEGGDALHSFATFEALSEAMCARGAGAGWHGWPEDYRNCHAPAVADFARQNRQRVEFFAWLQWLAISQLREAEARARAAGMRIGLYLDLAVGVAPDGMATWADPDLVIAGARIGAPPDAFNAQGQDWGLAPLSPAGLVQRDLAPFARDLRATMQCAGAVRIDHAMALQRLFWIPGEAGAAGGSYVRYPFESMLQTLSSLSHEWRTLVIGEDLGTVPEGFRERMREAEIQSYRVMQFERDWQGAFLAPAAYPREAVACLSTHDLPTQHGWWAAGDVELRERLGLLRPDEAVAAHSERMRSRQLLLEALISAGLLDRAAGEQALSAGELPRAVAVAAHAYVARTPSRLMVAQLEDLVGEREPVNLPGTFLEYPNWQKTMSVALEDIAAHELFAGVTKAISAERPR